MEALDVIADRFEIERLAGTGGMGEVWRARDRLTGHPVAVKVLFGNKEHERFTTEAMVLAELHHPGIVRYIAHGTTGGGSQYLAMEWLEGFDLDVVLRRGALSVDASVALAARVADALGAAHARRIVHRDIKPSNLFLVEGEIERVRLLDFGVARLDDASRQVTHTGVVIGTPGYMAPEQARGARELDARADVFSLGCVLFECITGRPAFIGEHVMALLAKILLEDVPRVSTLCRDVTPALDLLIASMVHKDPERRPRDGAAVLLAIQELGNASISRQPRITIDVASALTSGEQRLLCVVTAGSGSATVVTSGLEATLAPDVEDAPLEGLRQVVAEHGGRLEQLADGSLVVILTGASGSAMDQAAQAARCALAMRPLLPDVAISLATGRGMIADRWPVGEVIDRAVRQLRLAEKAERAAADAGARPRGLPIRIDEVTAGLLDTRFETGGDVRGLYVIAERDVDEGGRTLLGKATPCIGREVDLRTLEATYAECASEPLGRAVLVTAPTGAGKSRLRYELLQRLARSEEPPAVWIGRGDPISAGSPFGMIAQAIRRVTGVLDGEPTSVQQQKLRARVARHVGDADRARVSEFIGELLGVSFPDEDSVQLRAARQDAMLMGDQMRRAWEDLLRAECAAQPLVLVLEDLHWGDLPTVKFVESALRALEDSPFLVLALARPEVLELFPKLWAGRAVTHLTLGELTRKASEKLVRHVLGPATPEATVRRIIDRAQGNAFYLEELIRAVAEGQGDRLPETVVAMVQARLEGLPAEARRVLRAASVFGQVFWTRGVRALLGESERSSDADRWLEDLAQRELVIRRADAKFPGEDELVFRNALVREAAYAMLTDADRAVGHGLAAEWLERAGEHEPMVMAEHFERGGAPLRAVSWYQQAAEQALEGNDFAATLERAERGVTAGADGEVLAMLRLLQAKAHMWRGDLADAEIRASEALQRMLPGSPGWYATAGDLAVIVGKLGRDERLAELGEGLRDRFAADPTSAQVIAAVTVAQRLLLAGNYDLAATLLLRIEVLGVAVFGRDPSARARFQQSGAIKSSFNGDPAGYLRLMKEAAAGYREAGELRMGCSTLGNVGYAYMELGQYELAETTLREAQETAERLGLLTTSTNAAHNLGLVLARLGRLDEARIVEAEAVASFRAQGNVRMEAGGRIYSALIAEASGDLVTAESEARAAVALLPTPPVHCFALATLADALLAQGRATEALASAREAMALLEDLGSIDAAESLVRLAHAEAHWSTGDEQTARISVAAARDRLLSRAARITEVSWRESFLRRVPENARTLRTATEWLPDDMAHTGPHRGGA